MSIIHRDTLYFAYGSNMSWAQMKDRCHHSKVRSIGKLRGWEFVINERGVATLRKSRKAAYGVVYEISSVDEAYLDMYEGVSIGRYGKFLLPVEICDRVEVRTCLVYIDPCANPGLPRPGYLERVVRGARFHGLPRRYIRKLKKWRSYEDEEQPTIKPSVRLWDSEEVGFEPPSPTGD